MEKLKFDDYPNVFNASAVVKYDELFVGRKNEIFILNKAISRRGQHAVIFGRRGIGKTSLAEIALKKCSIQKVELICGKKWSFIDFSYQLLKKLGKDPNTIKLEEHTSDKINVGSDIKIIKAEGENSKFKSITYRGLEGTHWDASALSNELWDYKTETIVILDEYDLVDNKNYDFHSNVSSFLKAVSDHPEKLPFTFIIIGIAKTANELLGGHKSSGRNLNEIFLKYIDREALSNFLKLAQGALGITIESEVKERMINGSFGYPYYIHLIAENICDSIAIEDPKRRDINIEYYKKGIERAIELKYQDLKDRYMQLLDNIPNLGKEILKRLSLYYDQKIRDEKQICAIIVPDKYLTYEEYLKGITQINKSGLPIRIQRYVNIGDPLFLPFLKKYYWGSAKPEIESIDQLKLFN